MSTTEFNKFSDAVAARKIAEAASQVADWCREVVESGEMTASDAAEFGNQWMSDVQDRAAEGGF